MRQSALDRFKLDRRSGTLQMSEEIVVHAGHLNDKLLVVAVVDESSVHWVTPSRLRRVMYVLKDQSTDGSCSVSVSI